MASLDLNVCFTPTVFDRGPHYHLNTAYGLDSKTPTSCWSLYKYQPELAFLVTTTHTKFPTIKIISLFLNSASQCWLGVFESCCQLCVLFFSVTHHTSCLYSLRHISSIGLTPEDVTVKTMAANIHDKGKGVHVTANTHERQETNTTLHQHFLFVLVRHTLQTCNVYFLGFNFPS